MSVESARVEAALQLAEDYRVGRWAQVADCTYAMITLADEVRRLQAVVADQAGDDVATLRKEVDRLLADNVRLRALKPADQVWPAKLGVGDGSGSLFINGSYEAVKRVQVLMDESNGLRTTLQRRSTDYELQIERLQKVVADQALTIATLKDEIGRLNKENDHWHDVSNQLRAALESCEKAYETHTNELRAKLRETECLREDKYADLSAFKPSPEYEAALKKAMDRLAAWHCAKCGASGRTEKSVSDPLGYSFADGEGVRIVCSKGCV